MHKEVLDIRIFEALAVKMFYSCHQVVSNINRFPSCNANLSKSNIAYLVTMWEDLNKRSCMNTRRNYAVHQRIIHFDLLPVSTYQFYKWLECLDYNIDVPSISPMGSSEVFAMNFMRQLIREVREVLISSNPEYIAARWSTF